MEKPVPLAFGITDLDVGGAERALTELVTRLDRSVWSPSVVSLVPTGAMGKTLENAGIPVHSLELKGKLDVWKAYRRWRQLLKQQKPALLQTFLFHANILGRFVAPLAGVRHVVSGIRVADPRSRIRLLADRLTQGLCDCHVCVSEGVRQFMNLYAGVPLQNSIVIPNGVDVEMWAHASPIDRARWGLDVDRALLVFVGRLDRQKGLEELLLAVSLACERAPVEDLLQIALVGAGPDRARLEIIARDKALTPIVKFMGWQPNPGDWLASADGLILPSRWEGMPNVILEAMAAGLPVIATAVEGSTELVVPGRTGWLTRPGNIPELADTILEFLCSPGLRAEMGIEGRSRVAELFSYDIMVKRYDQLYRRVLGMSTTDNS